MARRQAPPSGWPEESLVVADPGLRDSRSRAELVRYHDGTVALHCENAGDTVRLIVAEDACAWHWWYVLEASDVPRLALPEQGRLEAIRDALALEPGSDASAAASRFTAWAREQGVELSTVETVEYDD